MDSAALGDGCFKGLGRLCLYSGDFGFLFFGGAAISVGAEGAEPLSYICRATSASSLSVNMFSISAGYRVDRSKGTSASSYAFKVVIAVYISAKVSSLSAFLFCRS